MKNYFTKTILIIGLVAFTCQGILAQGQIYDAVTIGPGYTNQSFYSMANGEINNVINTDWDLAFQIAGFQASILINSKNNVRLFKSGLDINSWANISANDTVGVLNSNNELFNQDTSWWTGAFNTTNDINNQFDLGWGVYDFATHVVAGDSLYFIKLSNGIVKKIWIQSLQNSTYTFVYADVDGTNEVTATLTKTNFPGKNFGYYSIINGITIDREPNKYLWDLTFMQYMATTPFIYKVTGVLSNDSVLVAKAYPVDPVTVLPWTYPSSYLINTIGYNWKTFDLNNMVWVIEDSTVYFVTDRNGALWKLVFTAFSGAANGDYEFNKELISSTGMQENGGQPTLAGIYPNPAISAANLVCFFSDDVDSRSAGIYDLNGRLVTEIQLPSDSGLHQVTIDTRPLNPGMYVVKVSADGIISTEKLLIQ